MPEMPSWVGEVPLPDDAPPVPAELLDYRPPQSPPDPDTGAGADLDEPETSGWETWAASFFGVQPSRSGRERFQVDIRSRERFRATQDAWAQSHGLDRAQFVYLAWLTREGLR